MLNDLLAITSYSGSMFAKDQTQLATLFSLDTNTLGTISLGLQFYSMRLDGTRLFIQITATLLLIAILYFALRSNLLRRDEL
jgi:hypothetical protein